MPSRWLVPIAGVDPAHVKVEQIHGALTQWFDTHAAEHAAQHKPYALSPMRETNGLPAVEVGLLTRLAEVRFAAATTPAAPPSTPTIPTLKLRLGGQFGTVATPRRIGHESWESLATPSGAMSWTLDFVTPTTFRRGNRSTPWPAPSAVLRGLADRWATWSGLGDRTVSHQQVDEVWVADIDGRSHPLVVSGIHLSGFIGRISYRCDDPAVAAIVDPLFRLAEYCGVGTATAKGLGVTRLVATPPSSARSDGARPPGSRDGTRAR